MMASEVNIVINAKDNTKGAIGGLTGALGKLGKAAAIGVVGLAAGATAACQFCGQSFSAKRAHIGRAKFCSQKCHDEARMKRVTLTCVQCGKEFMERQSKSAHKFCSVECRYIHMNGSGNHNWLGGTSFEPYPPVFNDLFKRMIRERDNNTCQFCGKRGNHVHHIDYCKGNTTPDNCVTLCRSCHMKTNGNREYWQDYFSSNSPDK